MNVCNMGKKFSAGKMKESLKYFLEYKTVIYIQNDRILANKRSQSQKECQNKRD